MAPGVDSLAKTPGKKVKKKQHRSQSFHQRPEPDNAKSPSVTAAEPRSGNSPPVLSKTVAASQEKPRSKVIDKPVSNQDVHDDDAMFDITQYLDMDKPDTTLAMDSPKEEVTMTSETQAEISNPNAENADNTDNVDNVDNAKSPSPNKTKKNQRWRRKAAKEKEKQKETGEGYFAPNGTYISPEELRAYAKGVKNENGDTVVFFPEFIEDPWKGLKPVLTERERRF